MRRVGQKRSNRRSTEWTRSAPEAPVRFAIECPTGLSQVRELSGLASPDAGIFAGATVNRWLISAPLQSRCVLALKINCLGFSSAALGLDDAEQPQEQKDQQDGANASGGVVAPTTAVGPGGDAANQKEDEDNKENQSHN